MNVSDFLGTAQKDFRVKEHVWYICLFEKEYNEEQVNEQ